MATTDPTVPTLQPIVARYLRERRERNEITRLTRDSLALHLHQFAEVFGRRPVDQLGQAALDRYMKAIAGYADSTRRTKLSAVKGFSRWMVSRRLIVRDFTIDAPRVRVTRRVPRDLTLEHFEQILTVTVDERERLCLWLAFGAGLRCVEMSRLRVEDFDPYNLILHVRGKGGHERTVPVATPVRHAIDAYLVTAPASTGPLIRPQRGGTLSPSRISHLIGDCIVRSGVKIRLHDGRSAHGLRAAAASDLYDACHDPRIVQEFLGHQHLQTTTIYLRRSGVERVREALNARQFATPAAVPG